MAVRDGDDLHQFIVGNDGGHFCPECPTVVLDRETFRDFAILSFGNDPRSQFTVLGLVDLAAIPEEMSSTPLGEDGNPVPLVEFIRSPAAGNKRQGITQSQGQGQSQG